MKHWPFKFFFALGMAPTALGRAANYVFHSVWILASLVVLCWAMAWAYKIRLHAVKVYGPVIHEFDPWFNYRATEYLAQHGWTKFFHWFDYMSWYPLGRPVGTTIYPGMQITAVRIWEALKYMPQMKLKIPGYVRMALPFVKSVLKFGPMSLNDVCVYIPAWFGSVATFWVFLLTKEISGSWTSSAVAALIMAIIPAHLMRSIAGGYDNESIAVSAICMTFWLWCRSLRTEKSWPIAILAGLSYIYMVAAWGGYIFVINMIGVHAASMVPLRLYNTGTYRAYTLFFIIGTLGATRVPVVGWAPLKSLEQLGPFVVFVVYQMLELCNWRCRRVKDLTWKQSLAIRLQVFGFGMAALAVLVLILLPTGYFGPLSSRIRGLFVKHTRTGNPLVDSVAEHQAATSGAYFQYLHHCKNLAVLGFAMCFVNRTPAKYFIIIYGLVASYFSLKMVRLLIICGPICSILAGVAVGSVFDWCIDQIWTAGTLGLNPEADPEPPKQGAEGKKGSPTTKSKKKEEPTVWEELQSHYAMRYELVRSLLFGRPTAPIRAIVASVLLGVAWQNARAPTLEFVKHCESMAQGMASPQIMFMSRDRNGGEFIVDDYLASYQWLAQNTPADARVMAWWDYGYQITGIGNRTSIADGNTWNHEHIATLARCLVSPERRGHKIIRHLADYVLIWAGGRGDDLAKSPHMCRIGNSVYPDISPGDPTCMQFGFISDRMQPTPMMEKSVLYKLHGHLKIPGVQVDPRLFKEVHSTKHGLVRIYKVLNVSLESKEWVADPANRVCDAPGSWYCSGQYPPALAPLIKKRRDFSQLEDFNRRTGEKGEYTKFVEEELRRS